MSEEFLLSEGLTENLVAGLRRYVLPSEIYSITATARRDHLSKWQWLQAISHLDLRSMPASLFLNCRPRRMQQ